MSEEVKIPKKRGRPPGGSNAGRFKKGQIQDNRTPKAKALFEALKKLIDDKAGKLPKAKTNGDLLVLRLWEYAMTAAPSNPKGLNAIVEIFDRLEGKAAPAAEELDAMKDNKTITVLLPKNDK